MNERTERHERSQLPDEQPFQKISYGYLQFFVTGNVATNRRAWSLHSDRDVQEASLQYRKRWKRRN